MPHPLNQNISAWAESLSVARDLDPVIREALRPVFDRLKAEAPGAAPAMSLAMICRALRMIQTRDGKIQEARMALIQVAMMEVAANPDHPSEGKP